MKHSTFVTTHLHYRLGFLKRQVEKKKKKELNVKPAPLEAVSAQLPLTC